MMVRALNNLDTIAPFSYLSNGEASGAASLRVQNINNYYASWAVQVGKTGEEQSEILMLGAAAPSGTALTTTANTLYDHPADTPVYAIKYDQIVFERSTVGTAGTATPLGTVTITPDSTFTQYDDTTGASTYAYKTYFRNSVTAGTSTESDWITPAGFSFYSLAKMRDRVKRKLFDSGYIKDDQTIDDWLNEWLEVLNGAAIKVNKDYLLGTVDVGISSTTGLGTITNADFKEIRRVDFTTDGVSYFMATKMDRTGFLTSQTFNAAHPYYFYEGDTTIGMRPYATPGTARLVYYKVATNLVNDADELPVSMHLYTKSFVDWAVAQALWVDGKDDRANKREQMAYAERDRFISEITPRSMSGAVMIDLVEPTSGGDDEGYY